MSLASNLSRPLPHELIYQPINNIRGNYLDNFWLQSLYMSFLCVHFYLCLSLWQGIYFIPFTFIQRWPQRPQHDQQEAMPIVKVIHGLLSFGLCWCWDPHHVVPTTERPACVDQILNATSFNIWNVFCFCWFGFWKNLNPNAFLFTYRKPLWRLVLACIWTTKMSSAWWHHSGTGVLDICVFCFQHSALKKRWETISHIKCTWRKKPGHCIQDSYMLARRFWFFSGVSSLNPSLTHKHTSILLSLLEFVFDNYQWIWRCDFPLPHWKSENAG